VDKEVAARIVGPDGAELTSAVLNAGQVQAGLGGGVEVPRVDAPPERRQVGEDFGDALLRERSQVMEDRRDQRIGADRLARQAEAREGSRAQSSRLPAMKASVMRQASSSGYCRGGCFMKYAEGG